MEEIWLVWHMYFTQWKETDIHVKVRKKKKKLPFHFVNHPLAQPLQSLCTPAVQILGIPETQNNEDL